MRVFLRKNMKKKNENPFRTSSIVLLIMFFSISLGFKERISSPLNSILIYLSGFFLLIAFIMGSFMESYSEMEYDPASPSGYRKKNKAGLTRSEIDRLQYSPRVKIVKVKNPHAKIDLDCHKCGTTLNEEDTF
jgi:hypothetical protein